MNIKVFGGGTRYPVEISFLTGIFGHFHSFPNRLHHTSMAQPPLLTLSDIRLAFGGKPLFEGVNVSISRGERAALVGRNGAGKSTLMKIVAGRFEPDSGEIWIQPGTRVVTVEQEPDLSQFDTVLDYAMTVPDDARSGPEWPDITIDHFRAEAEIEELGLDPRQDPKTMSGGQLRRAAIARAFASEPDILLLDEPTNHLDVPMINMLEQRLKAFRGAILLVSHDRLFLTSVSTNTLWLRQGEVLKSPQGYGGFDDWAGEIEDAEEKALRRIKTQLKDEQRWLARGVTGRRKRNMGRLARMKDMRAEHAKRRSALGEAKAVTDLNAEIDESTSRKIIEVRGISKAFDTPNGRLNVVEDFSLRVLRGDRIGLIGPNGVGKSTLVKLLLKEMAPDKGSVKRAKTIEVTYLDQTRETLNPKDTLWEALAPFGGDSITVQGRQRHVAAYAKDFLFKPDQLRQPVSALSGGERNRLTLAIALAQPANLLVLDEPTNDLDMQTLDLLEEMLANFEGTLLLVSHDRSFLDNTVTSCLCPVGDGKWIQTAGGWSDALEQLPIQLGGGSAEPAKTKSKVKTALKPTKSEPQKKLSFKDKHRLETLETEIPALEAEIAALEAALADPELYARDANAFTQKTNRLAAAREELDQAEMDWLEIEEKKEALG